MKIIKSTTIKQRGSSGGVCFPVPPVIREVLDLKVGSLFRIVTTNKTTFNIKIISKGGSDKNLFMKQYGSHKGVCMPIPVKLRDKLSLTKNIPISIEIIDSKNMTIKILTLTNTKK